jgi:4-hydroxy-3-methylbut-2-enyl diphosphate reductase
LICAGLRIEARAVRRGLPSGAPARVAWVGMGARHAAGALGTENAVAVAGFGGALDDGLRAGDVLVADEVRTAGPSFACAAPAELAKLIGELGVAVRTGPLFTADHVVHGAERRELAAKARAVDMETGPVAALAGGHPLAAVRVIVDTPSAPLVSLATPRGGLVAHRVLRRLGPALTAWAEGLGTRPTGE